MSLQGTFKALSDSTRRDILILLKKDKMIAGDIAQKIGISPASLSYHLNLLKKNDLIIETKEKNYVYYELNTSLFDELIIWLKQF
ncbi:autorepressor SdpR family transcription factor [Oscillospiraceae bacterium LCP25S3_E10]